VWHRHRVYHYLGGEGGQAEVAPQSVEPEVEEDDLGVGVEFVELLQIRQLLAREHKGHVDVRPFNRLEELFITTTVTVPIPVPILVVVIWGGGGVAWCRVRTGARTQLRRRCRIRCAVVQSTSCASEQQPPTSGPTTRADRGSQVLGRKRGRLGGGSQKSSLDCARNQKREGAKGLSFG